MAHSSLTCRGRHHGAELLCLLVVCATLVACGDSKPRVQDADGDSVLDVQDCAPNNPSISLLLSFQSEDADSDSHFVNSSGSLCAGAALPPRYAAGPIAGNADCDDANATRWQLLAHVALDADLDGHSIAGAGAVCSGASLPAGYLAALLAPPADCDDGNASTWRLMTVYADADGDGVGAGGGAVTCVGSSAAASFSLLGYDPDPSSPAISALDLPSWQLATP